MDTKLLIRHAHDIQGQFLEIMREFVIKVLVGEEGDRWPGVYSQALRDQQLHIWNKHIAEGEAPKDLIDFSHLPGVFIKHRGYFVRERTLKREVGRMPSLLEEIVALRNDIAHHKEPDPVTLRRAYENMSFITEWLGQDELHATIAHLLEGAQQNAGPNAPAPPPRVEFTAGGLVEDAPPPAGWQPGQLLPWYGVVAPHVDVRSGQFNDAVFAANLNEVASQSGETVYADPFQFFSKTYFTRGLQTIATRVLKGLYSVEALENRSMTLQTGFGGGKTHTLISLYHLSQAGKDLSELPGLEDVAKACDDLEFQPANVAVFTNATNNPSTGRTAEDGTPLKTIWGDLAYQLGGKEGYALVKESDAQMIAPGHHFKKVLQQAAPCLILIDELADYCVKASGKRVGEGSLADQTISFAQDLTEAIAQVPQCVLVATLPQSENEMTSSVHGASILSALSSRFSRVAADTKPVEDEEIFEVIRRRLFENLGHRQVREAVVNAYMEHYDALKTNLPSRATKSEYRKQLEKAYPFHPELINVFRYRWASHSDFQRTRGVLRILAAITSDLYRRKDGLTGQNYLVHPSDVVLDNLDALSSQVKKLFGNNYDAVMTADVYRNGSNAAQIDLDKPELGEHDLGKGLSITILLNSFGRNETNAGMSVAELKLSMLKPQGFNHNLINTALDEMENRAHYLYYSSNHGPHRRYWFYTKPNLNILVNQASQNVSPEAVDSALEEMLRNQLRKVQAFNTILFPEPKSLEEQKRPTLVFVASRYPARGQRELPEQSEEYIRQVATEKGNGQRVYRNTLFFVLPHESNLGKLRSAIRNLVACQTIERDYRGQLDAEQSKDLQSKNKEYTQQIDRALVYTYCQVVRYSAKHGATLITIHSNAHTLGEATENDFVKKMKEEEWLMDGVGYNWLERNGMAPQPGKPFNAREMYEAFLKFDDKLVLTGPEALESSLRKHCQEKLLAIGIEGDGEGYRKTYLGNVPNGFSVRDNSYWVLHPEDYQPDEPQPIPQPVPPSGVEEVPTPPTGGRPGSPDGTGDNPTPTPSKNYEKVWVHGHVSPEQFPHIFTGFLNPLRQNQVQVKVEIVGKSTAASPLEENGQLVKTLQEVARQLGVEIRFE